MVQSVYVDQEAPYDPHRQVFMQLREAPINICEMVAQTPTELPCERPTGPCRQYSREQVPITATIDEHAVHLMTRIEDELVCKYHVDHIVDHHGRSPYKGRSEGFKIRKLQLADQMKPNEDHSHVVKMYKWAMQQVCQACKLHDSSGCPTDDTTNIIRRVQAVLDKQDHAIEAPNCPSPYERLLKWRESCEGGGEHDGLKAVYEDLRAIVDLETHRLANERTVSYQKFMKHAVSHKNGQIFHIILRKKVETTARPVSKAKFGTTEDQHHAEEQINVWAKIWKAEVDAEPVVLGHSNRLSFQEPGCPSNITSPRLSFHDPGCPLLTAPH